MKSKVRRGYLSAFLWFLIFSAFTGAAIFVDVQQIGPGGSAVGFASVNGPVANLLPFNPLLYTISEYLGYIAFLFVVFFAFVGIVQMLKRHSPLKVDSWILLLGVFYCIVAAFYILFLKYAVNYRPVVIDAAEGLESSYPSSHTVLAVCVFLSSILQWHHMLQRNRILRSVLDVVSIILTVSLVVCRFISGVHWLTDIIGGILLSIFLLKLYCAFLQHAEFSSYRKKLRESDLTSY